MQTPDPCVLVILGASGDLTHRKLIPALYEMSRAGVLPANTCILGVSRTPKTDEAFRAELEERLRERTSAPRVCVPAGAGAGAAGGAPKGTATATSAASTTGLDPAAWSALAERIHYHAADAIKPDSWTAIKERICALDAQHNCGGNVLFYLSVAPNLYEPIIANIDSASLVTEGKLWCSLDRTRRVWQRIVVEKPFGQDLGSARALNRALGRVFEEDAIYRIDHYLGKEVVQNLLVFRFANTIFEPIWNARYIDHVQITAAETLGVEDRANFYDQTGAIRDMIQSHLLQILAFVAMEPPSSYTADQIRAEKRKIVESIQLPHAEQLDRAAALGQYGDYADLKGVRPNSTTETFAALRFTFDNWRWGGTPFYLRTGKRMAAKCTQIVVQFKQPAANLFRTVAREPMMADRVIVEVAPHEQIRVRFNSKVPGPGIRFRSTEMEMDYCDEFATEPVEAYGPLIIDVMRGDQSLFKSREESEDAWRAVMPFLSHASDPIRAKIRGNYAPGSWGPQSADELLAREGRAWHNPPTA